MKELDSTRNKWYCMCNASYRISQIFPRSKEMSSFVKEVTVGDRHWMSPESTSLRQKPRQKRSWWLVRKTKIPPKSLKGFTELERFLFDTSQISGERLHSSTDIFDAIIGRSIEYLDETSRSNDGKYKILERKKLE